MNKGALLYKAAKRLIPGGTQLLSKRPEMFIPDKWPSYYKKCKGVYVWDMGGKKYADMTICGVGACALGYADNDVDSAVIEAVKAGNMCTLNVPEEVELAELLCKIHPWADMVRYARTGGEAMAVAVRIARAATGKEKILFCGYHGWHDWYISANIGKSRALDGHLLPGLEPLGIPRVLRGTSIPFRYNDLKDFECLVAKEGKNAAAVVMEPVRNYWPEKGFLEGVRHITKKKKIPLVFDEITSGFRMAPGGIHMKLRVRPDMAVFAKALGNGYPIAAIIGKAKIMKAAQKSFISSTYWTDRIGPVAALATLKKYIKYNVGDHLVSIGNLAQDGWKTLAEKYELEINVTGIPPLSHWGVNSKDNQLINTVITERMLERGFLSSSSFYPTFAHKKDTVNKYLKALDSVLCRITPYIKENKIRNIYKGPAAHAGFRRIT